MGIECDMAVVSCLNIGSDEAVVTCLDIEGDEAMASFWDIGGDETQCNLATFGALIYIYQSIQFIRACILSLGDMSVFDTTCTTLCFDIL